MAEKRAAMLVSRSASRRAKGAQRKQQDPHTMLTLGKAQFGVKPTEAAKAAEVAAPAEPNYCTLARFKIDDAHANAKKTCGYCGSGCYHYCEVCFPCGMEAEYGICSSNTKTAGLCFAKHVAGVPHTHTCTSLAGKRPLQPTRHSPRIEQRARVAGAGGSGIRPMPTL
jgi:hypothetical protein